MSLIEATQPRLMPNRKGGGWTDQKIEDLKRLWLVENLCAREIAAELGVTRNAVVGKIFRLKLPDRPQDVSGDSKRTHNFVQFDKRPMSRKALTMAAREAKAAPLPEPAPFEPQVTACTLLELTDDQCHFPIGEPGAPDFVYCGQRANYRSYCGCHARLAYQVRRR